MLLQKPILPSIFSSHITLAFTLLPPLALLLATLTTVSKPYGMTSSLTWTGCFLRKESFTITKLTGTPFTLFAFSCKFSSSQAIFFINTHCCSCTNIKVSNCITHPNSKISHKNIQLLSIFPKASYQMLCFYSVIRHGSICMKPYHHLTW